MPPVDLSTAAVLEAGAMLLAFVVALFVGLDGGPGTPVGAARSRGGAAREAQRTGPVRDRRGRGGDRPGRRLVLPRHAACAFRRAVRRGDVFAFGLAGWLYWRAARERDAPAGFWRAFFLGRELNPAWFGVDLKLFSYRPSLMGLALLNASFAVAQYETHGELTLAMTLYQVFAFLYVLNYFQFEHGMVHTWDIVSERFGWMLVWGDYVLVPFFYCIAGWWLVDAGGPPLSPWAAAGIVAAVRLRVRAVPRRERAEAPIQARPRDEDLGQDRRVARRTPAGLRVLGCRAASELHRRDLRLSRLRADHRFRVPDPVPVAGLADGTAGAPGPARRAALPREVRRALGPLHRARAVLDAAVRLLTPMPSTAHSVELPRSRPRSPRTAGRVPELTGRRPLVGHLPEFQKDPVAMLTRGERECGELFGFRLGPRPFVLFAGPEAHDAYFRSPDDQLDAKSVYRFTVPIFGRGVAYDVSPQLMTEQLGFLFPALRESSMRRFARIMFEETCSYADALDDEGELDLPTAMNELTVNIASRCFLGEEVRSAVDAGFAEAYHDLQKGINTLGFFLPRLPTPGHRSRDRARRTVTALFTGIMRERRRSGADSEDFMQTLMAARYKDGRALSDDEITGILLAALFAGQHTSAVLATWTGSGTAAGRGVPGAREGRDGGRLRRHGLHDLRGAQATAALENAVRECERLHPPLIILVRKALRPLVYRDHVVPAGTLAMVSPAVSHRLPRCSPIRTGSCPTVSPRRRTRTSSISTP